MTNVSERFGYDAFNRLDTIVTKKNNSVVNRFYLAYDASGNITEKGGVGSYGYAEDGNPYSINTLSNVANPDDFAEDQLATYTTFNKLATLEQGDKHLQIVYGPDDQRVWQQVTNGGQSRTKRYFTQLYETVSEDSVTKNLHYLYAPSGLFAIFATSDNTETMHYTFTDHQGSLAAYTGNAKEPVTRLSYDAWGRRRNAEDGSYGNVPALATDRGYTGHEHLDAFGLINMKFALSESRAKFHLGYAERCKLGEANGRLYDPMLGRMLSPDIVVQQTDYTQSYNRYSYCFNNPLRFTDPTGWVVRGTRDYLDWNFKSSVESESCRSNGNAFNTDLSEGDFSPIYDVNGKFLGTTKEGFTGQVLIYDGTEDVDFSVLSEDEALLIEDVYSYDKISSKLTGEAKSNIWTNIVSQMEGVQVYDEVFHINDIYGNKIICNPNIDASWRSSYALGTGVGKIQGSNKYNYETTVENIQSSIIVHEYYSHIKKNNGDNFKSHRLAYKNVINYKPLWNNTTNAYKGFVVRQLLKYTTWETGRKNVDPLYRYSFNKYKDFY